MNQIEKICAEIERRIQHAKDNPQRYPDATSSIWSLQGILSFIESLEKEQFAGETMMEKDKIDTAFTKMIEKEQPEEPKIKGWVARDKDGTLVFYGQKPDREIVNWDDSGTDEHVCINQNMFPDLKWEDEPIKVGLTISRVKTD